MKQSLKFIFVGAVLSLRMASAQIVLNNFSSFVSPNTFFTGDWELTGDVGGTNAPRSSFIQSVGYYNFLGGSNNANASAINFFDHSIDLTGNSVLQLSARLIAGNTAPNLTVSLFDSLGGSAFAVLPTSAFAGAGFTLFSAPLTYAPGFNASDVTSFALSGNVVGGSASLDISIDQLSVDIPRAATPVPEASSNGLVGTALLIAAVFIRRLRKR